MVRLASGGHADSDPEWITRNEEEEKDAGRYLGLWGEGGGILGRTVCGSVADEMATSFLMILGDEGKPWYDRGNFEKLSRGEVGCLLDGLWQP